MKKTFHLILRQGGLSIAFKIALTMLFHVAYPTIEIIAGIHAVLALFSAALAWFVCSVPQMINTTFVSHEASPEVEA